MTKKYSFHYLVYLAIAALLYSCASTGSPSGGPKDTTPPQIVEEKSTANFQTLFSEKKIELVFDEFIEIDNVSRNLVISPPLLYIPEVEVRGKKLTLKINDEEVLKDNATYIINFGDAIKDFRQGNKLADFKFVFSTGPFIDSLEMTGTVIDALTGKPKEEILVMLYDDLSDSIVYRERPFYFAKTDKSGNYKLSNIKDDTFKIFALKDENLNYLYDLEVEEIGFLDTLIQLSDTLENKFDLESFLPHQSLKLTYRNVKKYGLIDLVFNQSPEEVQYEITDTLAQIIPEVSGDTLKLWYHNPSDSLFYVYVPEDTVKVKVPSKNQISKGKLRLTRSHPKKGQKLIRSDSVSLTFNYPIRGFNEDSITLSDTSATIYEAEYKLGDDQKSLWLFRKWKEDKSYDLTLLPGAVSGIYGRINDTITSEISVTSSEKLGKINLTFTEMDSSQNYVILLNKEEEVAKLTLFGVSEKTLSFSNMVPGDYSITIIKDDNKNGKWDPGDYERKKQSERIMTKELESLRENWELEAEVSVQF